MQAGRKRIQYADSQRQNSNTTALLLAKDKTKLKLGQLETVDENRAHRQVWGTTWQRAGTHADTKYRRGTGQRANIWETRLTLITQTRQGRTNRTSRTQTEDYQSKTVSTLNFTDSDPQVDTMTTRTWQQREHRHVGRHRTEGLKIQTETKITGNSRYWVKMIPKRDNITIIYLWLHTFWLV